MRPLRRREIVAVLLVALGTAAVWWGDARLTRELLETPARSSDFVNITAYQTKIAEPDLFPRDYLFSDPAGAEQYTPSYRILLGALTSVTGDWREAVVLLSPLLVFVYVLTMTAFLRLFARPPSTRELATFVKALENDPDVTPRVVLWTLISSPEYQTY